MFVMRPKKKKYKNNYIRAEKNNNKNCSTFDYVSQSQLTLYTYIRIFIYSL